MWRLLKWFGRIGGWLDATVSVAFNWQFIVSAAVGIGTGAWAWWIWLTQWGYLPVFLVALFATAMTLVILRLFIWLWREASVEPSHLIIIGIVGVLVFATIALGGVLWQQYRPAVASTPAVSYVEPVDTVGRAKPAEEIESKIAIYNSTITYNTYYLDSGARETVIRSSDESYSDKSNTFVKFRASGEVLDSNNVESITDSGIGDYTINFVTNLNKDTLVVTPVGDTPRDFRVVGVAAGSVNVQFAEPEPELIHLKFED